MVDFYHEKGIDILKLGCTLPILNIFVFTSQLLQGFIPSQRATGIYWRKFVKTWLVDRLLYSNGKLLWKRLLFGVRQTCAKVLSEMLQVSFILSQCVKQCQPSVHEKGARLRIWQTLTASKQDKES